MIYVSCSTQTTDVNMTDVVLRPSALLCTCPTYTCDWDVCASICRQWHQQATSTGQWGRCSVYRHWHPLSPITTYLSLNTTIKKLGLNKLYSPKYIIVTVVILLLLMLFLNICLR